MSFSALDGAAPPYLLLIVFGFLPSVAGKLLAAFVAHGIDENFGILVWVRAVATTLLAGVACKLLVGPPGRWRPRRPAAWVRFGALALGMLAWRVAGRSVAAAVIAGEAGCMAGTWWAGG